MSTLENKGALEWITAEGWTWNHQKGGRQMRRYTSFSKSENEGLGNMGEGKEILHSINIKGGRMGKNKYFEEGGQKGYNYYL